jgi:hypothetical protein
MPDKSRDRKDAEDRPQDPLVERLRPDPAQPAQATKTLVGMLGDSDRPGHRRLYFTAELDSYAEFRAEDVIAYADIPPEQSPFLGEPATRATLRRDATVTFTRTQGARPLDEFDLDVRLGAGLRAADDPPTFGCPDTEFFGCTQFCTMEAICGGPTNDGCPLPTRGCETVQITICRGATCIDVCETRQKTLCETRCGTCNPRQFTCGRRCVES